MNSLKVFSFLLVVGLSQSAPQISQQGVVSQVLGQLQPAIARTLAEILGGRTSATQGVTGAVKSSTSTSGFGQEISSAVRSSSGGFGLGATGAVSTTSSGQVATSAVRTANIGSSTSSQSGLSASQLTSSVVSSLQPSIAAAVAQALRASSAVNSRVTSTSAVTSSASALTEEEEARLNAQQSANAQYEYGYKVADDDSQAYMAHQETRNGLNVEGSYNYVDANGALVTVTYQAGPEGYTENREVQDGAVQMRNIPGPWAGPFADTVPAGVSATAAVAARAPAVASSSVNQAQLIQRILSQLQPQISGAVQAAISSSSRTTTRSQGGATVGGVFAGDNSVRIQTPEFNIAY